MKQFFLALSLFCGYSAFSQVAIIPSSIYYMSKARSENFSWVEVGKKVLFRQECTTELPPEFPNGIVFYENVWDSSERFAMSVEFKDTVIVSVKYFFTAKQEGLLKTIGYAEIAANETARKGEWTYIEDKDRVRTVMVGDKKKITVIQTLK